MLIQNNLFSVLGFRRMLSVYFFKRFPTFISLLCISVVLSGCGGGGSGNTKLPVLPASGPSSPETPENTYDVIVIGAGSAGLYATKTLQGYGYDVLIIEATDRIGGRVKSASLGDMRVELGAEEHYMAEGDNPVWPAISGEFGDHIYVQPYEGLTAYSMDEGVNTCWTKSFALRPCTNDADVVTMWDFWDWYWPPQQHQNPSTTLAEEVQSEFGVGANHRGYHLYDAGIAGGTFATNLHKLGARSVALQSNEWTLSNGVRVLGDKNLGYLDALETVWWDDVVANSELLLNSPVETVDTSGENVLVIDSSGEEYLARQVIITVSIGVLQAELIDFIPDLPSTTVAAYNGIGIDSGMKVPMRFASAWWETEGDQLAWVVTEGVAGACWVPSNYKHNTFSYILMCYPMGDNSTTLSEIGAQAGGGSDGDQAIIDAILADLDKTFPQALGQPSENFIDGLVQDWGRENYTLGAYSYPKVETFLSTEDNKRRDLKAPVANDRIFFAGEATHETHPATVVGALHEGERAAHAVHSVNGVPNNSP